MVTSCTLNSIVVVVGSWQMDWADGATAGQGQGLPFLCGSGCVDKDLYCCVFTSSASDAVGRPLPSALWSEHHHTYSHGITLNVEATVVLFHSGVVPKNRLCCHSFPFADGSQPLTSSWPHLRSELMTKDSVKGSICQRPQRQSTYLSSSYYL